MMKQVLFALAFLGISGLALAQVQVGVSIGSGGDSFQLALGNYYQAPPAEVQVCQQRHIPDEEMPVVFFLAKRLHVAPGVIVDLRAGGMPWVNIFSRYHVNPRVLYVPMHGSIVGTPYAGYYSYYRNSRHARLVDADIVNMVNLKFASDYYHHTPDEVMKLRASGHDYRYIHSQYQPHRVVPQEKVRKDIRRDDRQDHRDDRGGNRRDDHQDDHHDDSR